MESLYHEYKAAFSSQTVLSALSGIKLRILPFQFCPYIPLASIRSSLTFTSLCNLFSLPLSGEKKGLDCVSSDILPLSHNRSKHLCPVPSISYSDIQHRQNFSFHGVVSYLCLVQISLRGKKRKKNVTAWTVWRIPFSFLCRWINVKKNGESLNIALLLPFFHRFPHHRPSPPQVYHFLPFDHAPSNS